ncbi:hypothetical protein D1872_269260 [compost metagenome]
MDNHFVLVLAKFRYALGSGSEHGFIEGHCLSGSVYYNKRCKSCIAVRLAVGGILPLHSSLPSLMLLIVLLVQMLLWFWLVLFRHIRILLILDIRAHKYVVGSFTSRI